jgi:hypothetical protein
MRNLFYNIYVLFESHLFITVLLLILASTVLAQSNGDSVFAANSAKPKTEDHTAAETALNEFLIGVMKQYPCLDTMSNSDVAALIGVERMKEVLGTEREGQTLDDVLKQIAGAMGARYFANFTATTLPNGKTVISGNIYDSRTGKMIANRLEQSEGANDRPRTADSVAKALLQDISSILKKEQCEPHWKGTITYTYVKQTSKTDTWTGAATRPNVKPNTSTTTKSENLSETAEVSLQPMTLGFSGDTIKTRVTQRYKYYAETVIKENGTTMCREPGRNPYMKEVSGDEKVARDHSGQNTVIHSVIVTISPNTGKYKVSMRNIEPLITTEKYERNGNIMLCTPVPFSSTREGQGKAGVGYIDIEGQVDPKNPDVLFGKKVEGDLENGQKTWTWNLQFVDPKKKK